MLAMLSGTLLVLVRVAVCAALFVPTPWLVKVNEDGDRVTVGSDPVPVRLRF